MIGKLYKPAIDLRHKLIGVVATLWILVAVAVIAADMSGSADPKSSNCGIAPILHTIYENAAKLRKANAQSGMGINFDVDVGFGAGFWVFVVAIVLSLANNAVDFLAKHQNPSAVKPVV